MAFNIQEMKSSIESNGYLPASSFDMLVNPPAGIGGGELLRIRSEAVALPGVSFAAVDGYKPYGTGRVYSIPHTFTPQAISVTHLIDTNGDILQTLNDWSNKIVDFKGAGGAYTARYFKTYVVDADIFIYDGDNQIAKTIKLISMYPSTVDQVQMAWGSSDELAKVSVNYQFLDYTIS
jgi:hypothetical protein